MLMGAIKRPDKKKVRVTQYEPMKSPQIERLPFVSHVIVQGHETKSIEIEVNGTRYLISSD